MSDDHGAVILAGILGDGGRRDLLLYAQQHLEDEHFRTDIHRNLFKMLNRYYEIAGGVLPKKTLSNLLSRSENIDTAKALLYEETFEALSNEQHSDADVRYAVDALKDLKAYDMTGEAFALGFEIMERGAEVGKENLRGHKEARDYIYEQFSTIDRLNNVESAPEGDMRLEGSAIWSEYVARKEGKVEPGVLTGIDSIDQSTKGLQRGELVLACAYTNQGKTQLACQIAWNAAVNQGTNVFYATSETVRPTIMRRIISRHSRQPQFEVPGGLNSKDIRDGTLKPEHEQVLLDVMDDLHNNPKYGKIYVAQIPASATLGYLEARMNRQAAQWDVGLAVMDYLALLKSNRVRGTEREEFNDIIRGAKVFASSFQEGRGVPFVSPWQIKQNAFMEALRTGQYQLASLSDTSEAEKSPDQIITLLRQPEVKTEITLQFLKLRDNEIPPPVVLETDFRNAYFADKSGGSSTGFGLSNYLD